MRYRNCKTRETREFADQEEADSFLSAVGDSLDWQIAEEVPVEGMPAPVVEAPVIPEAPAEAQAEVPENNSDEHEEQTNG